MQHTTGSSSCRTSGVLHKRILTISFALSCCLLLMGHLGNAADVKTQSLIDLHEDNWQMMLKGEWMVEFFAPWCPACKSLAPTWERYAANAISLGVNVAKIDVTTSPSLSGRFFVTALPTIYHVKDGEFRQYRGSRDADALMQYIKLKQWQSTEPISAWKKPDTIHMSILSYFFKLSHTLKDFNGRLQEEYGLPTWGSYALFAIGTIFVGAALGLVLVCVVDFLLPPKKSQRQSFSETKERTLNGVEDIANDEIEDDGERLAEGDEEATGDSEIEEEEDEQKTKDDDDKTSDEEKNSHSESEAPESEKPATKNQTQKAEVIEESVSAAKIEEQADKLANDLDEAAAAVAEATGKSTNTVNSNAEVRKRKPRKAD